MQKTDNEKLMLLPKCAVCDSKKLRFIKNQEAGGLLSNLELKTLLVETAILGDSLF